MTANLRRYEVLLSPDVVRHLYGDRFTMDIDWLTFYVQEGAVERVCAQFDMQVVLGVLDMCCVVGKPPPEITADDARPRTTARKRV